MSAYPDPNENAPHPYTALYPQHPNAQLLDGQAPRGVPGVPYPPPPEPGYPKLENINEVLQAQALHANHALTDQRPPPPGQVQISPAQQQQQQQQQNHNKSNRLRKACDSCSIRKVKVSESGAVVLLEPTGKRNHKRDGHVLTALVPPTVR